MKLQHIGLKHNTDKATYHKYLDFYQKHLPKVEFAGRLLEIGVMDGASLRMWREYYPRAEIIGIDTGLQWDLRIDGVTLLELDGTKPSDLKPLGMFDIIIDDASHYTKDQQTSFEHLFYKQLNKGGLYVIEDLHTSFLKRYVNSKINTIDYLKSLIGVELIYYAANKNKSMTCIIKAAEW